MPTLTPSPSDYHVKSFCATVVKGTKPTLLRITPDQNAEVDNCFYNVRDRVERHGGAIVFGWAIWEWPRVYIEAEHHAVYEPPGGGDWIDVTPSRDADTTRLFLPDPTTTYDFENEGVRVDNRRQALVRDPLVHEMLHLSEAKATLLNTVPGIGEIELVGVDADLYEAIEIRRVTLLHQIALKYTRGNDRCFCQSGKKFKKCHGRAA